MRAGSFFALLGERNWDFRAGSVQLPALVLSGDATALGGAEVVAHGPRAVGSDDIHAELQRPAVLVR